MAEPKKKRIRVFRATFTVLNRVRGKMTVNTQPVMITGAIAMSTIAQLEERIAQEWYLAHMGDPKFMDDPTDPANPLADFQVSITGLIRLECDEDGKRYAEY